MTSTSVVLLRTQSDERLVELARAGHEQAFEAIVERYRRPLLRACRRVLPESRAEDALQQTLLAAWRGLRRGDEVRELRPWLYRIAHNTSLNQLRLAGYDFDELQESLRITDAADDELERRAVVRQTLAGLAALPERQREALLAIAVEGRSQDEVAEVLGLSQGAVRQLVHRARTHLRAAATAITPLPLAAWLAAAGSRGDPVAQRIAELSAGGGGAGAAALLAKAGTVVVIGGAAVGGPAVIDTRHDRPPSEAAASAGRRAPAELDTASAPRVTPAVREVRTAGDGLTPSSGDDKVPSRKRESSRHRESGSDDDSSGPGSGSDNDSSGSDGDSSGPGSGSDDDSSGSGSSGSGDDSSGSGSSGSGDSSGSGTSGSGSSGSGSSGSGSSGSGSSGSGTSGSASSGSGSSGSGTSGSGVASSGSGTSGSGDGSSGSGTSGSDSSGSGSSEPIDTSGSGTSGGGDSSGSGDSDDED